MRRKLGLSYPRLCPRKRFTLIGGWLVETPPIGHPADAGHPAEIDGVFLKAPYFRMGHIPHIPDPPHAAPFYVFLPYLRFARLLLFPLNYFPRWPWAGKGAGEMKTGETGEMAM